MDIPATPTPVMLHPLRDAFPILIFVETIFGPLLGLLVGPLFVMVPKVDEFYTLGLGPVLGLTLESRGSR